MRAGAFAAGAESAHHEPMIRAFALLLPVLFPSWRFFAYIAPSPRIETALLGSADETARRWREFRPRPAHVPAHVMVRRMFWNPRWNETLFLVTCAEALLESGSPRRLHEIVSRVSSELAHGDGDGGAPRHLQIRLVTVRRGEDGLAREEVYRSPVLPLRAAPAP
ncbi:MAG: hypothetical protein MI723_05270 [Caulobacterales bacterium]|nr:hypothetical protein [Caulobacterales bacterium]